MDSFLKAMKTYIFLSRVGLSFDPGVHKSRAPSRHGD